MEREDAAPEGLSPAAAFALLGHEHRVDILHALLTANQEGVETPVPFADLFERTDIDVSSQFSYHLDELTGQFVRRTEEGYELRYAGWEVATSILAGTYTQRAEFGPTPIDGACPLCDERALEAVYAEEWLAIDCPACDTRHVRYPIPPGAVRPRSLPELLDAFDRYVRSHMTFARTGVCAGCFGVMSPAFDVDAGPDTDRAVRCTCRRCGNRLYAPLGLLFRDHGTVSTFLQERTGRSTPFWELGWCVTENGVTVTDTDPWRCRLEILAAGDRLVLVVDDELTVRSASVE